MLTFLRHIISYIRGRPSPDEVIAYQNAKIQQLQQQNIYLKQLLLSTMSRPTFINSSVVYNDHSKEFNINAHGTDLTTLLRACSAEDIEPCEPMSAPPKFFYVSEKFPEEDIRARLAAELNQSTTKREYCRALYQLQHMGCINIDQYASDAERAKVFNEYQSRFKLSASDFCKARASQFAQN